MKNIFKKLSCALLAAAMICTITPFTASADSSFVPPKTQVSYMGARSNYYAYGVIQLYNVPSKSSISKSNIKVISGKSVVSLESLTKDVSSGRTEYFAKGVKAYSYSNHTYRIGYNMLKTGTAKIQYKVGRKTYSTTVKVLPYTNPLKSLTVTGVGNLASRFSKNSSASNLRIKKAQSNALIKCTAASGWKIESIYYYNKKTGISRNIYSNKGVSSVTLHAGTLAAKQTGYISVNLTNTKTGGSQNCYIDLS